MCYHSVDEAVNHISRDAVQLLQSSWLVGVSINELVDSGIHCISGSDGFGFLSISEMGVGLDSCISISINFVGSGFNGSSLFLGEVDISSGVTEDVSEVEFAEINDGGSASVQSSDVGGGEEVGMRVEESSGVDVTDVGLEVDEVGVGAHDEICFLKNTGE